MKSPDKATGLLLDAAVDLLFQVHLLRGNCSAAAKALMDRRRLDERALDDCARLDDTLANIYRALAATVRTIQHSRAKRRRRVT